MSAPSILSLSEQTFARMIRTRLEQVERHIAKDDGTDLIRMGHMDGRRATLKELGQAYAKHACSWPDKFLEECGL